MRRALSRTSSGRIPLPPTLSNVVMVPPPVRGVVRNQNRASSDPSGAIVMENWVPTETGVRVRGGMKRHATLPGPALSLISYSSGANEELFAATADAIYEVTAPADAMTPPAATVSGLTGGRWTTDQLATPGGQFLTCVNDGTDAPYVYDGTDWTASTMTGATLGDLTSVWFYRSRAFFAERGSVTAHYLDVGLPGMTGALNQFSLSDAFTRGGSLMFGGTYSSDSGAGPDDYCYFMSDRGEFALYAGGDPSNADDWRLVGRYDIGARPLGKAATFRVGGDTIVGTTAGAIPLSLVLQRDPALLSVAAISAPIEKIWRDAAASRVLVPWSAGVSDRNGYAVFSMPASLNDADVWVVNLRTNAWCKWTGWPATGFATLGTDLMFSTGDGRVMVAEKGANDDGEGYVCRFASAYHHLGSPGFYKAAHMIRATFTGVGNYPVRVGAALNYEAAWPTLPPVSETGSDDVWGTARFDESVWGGDTESSFTTEWRSIDGNARVVTPYAVVYLNSEAAPRLELVFMEILYARGGVVG